MSLLRCGLVRSVGLAGVDSVNCYLEFVPFSMQATLEKVRAELFPELTTRVTCGFADMGTLARVEGRKEDPWAFIRLHPLWNHGSTPQEVIAFIFKHELLHLVIPGREVNGRLKTHPPEFWERERVLAPEAGRVWRWAWVNFGAHLRSRPRLERVSVKRSCSKILDGPRLPMQECERLFHKPAAYLKGLDREKDTLF